MRRSVLVAGVGAVGAMAALAGCGAGKDAATAQDLPSVPGVNVSEDGISVHNAVVAFSSEGYAAGEDAPVLLTFVNQIGEQVTLADVTSPVAADSTVVAATEIDTPDAPAKPEALPEQEATPPPPTPPADNGSTPDGVEVSLPASSLVDATLALRGLSQDVDALTSVPLELTFDNGVVIPLTVTMTPPDEPQPRGEHLDVGHH